jgi:ABC-type polysaccharide/polyol phosphate export permease
MSSDNRSFNFDTLQHKGIVGFLTVAAHELVVYRHAWFNLVSTALSTRYRRSTLGFLWTLLNPLFTMLIISTVFSTIFHHSFSDFSLYLFSGQMPWLFISNSIVFGASSIVLAETYLKKVYMPKFIFPLTTVGVETMNFLFSFIGLSLLAVALGVTPSLTWLLIPFALLLTASFVFGIILIVSCITVYFRDLAHILQILFLGLFYLSPIMYKPEQVAGSVIVMLKLNPFFYFIDMFHSIIYYRILPSTHSLLICIVLTLASLVIGLIVFSAKEKDLIYRL